MYTIDEFGDNEWDSFHDVVYDVVNRSLGRDGLISIFLSLPEYIRDTAHMHGLSDSVFRDNAYVFLCKNPPRLSPTFDETVDFIKIAHDGQFDKGGAPYWEHPRAVAAEVRLFCISHGPLPGVDPKHEALAALLHDVIEDTAITAKQLLEVGYPEEVVTMVEIVSKPDGYTGTYAEFIDSIVESSNIGAMRVKLADMKHNSDPKRIAQLPVEKRGVRNRYLKARKIIGDALKLESARLAKLPEHQRVFVLVT